MSRGEGREPRRRPQGPSAAETQRWAVQFATIEAVLHMAAPADAAPSDPSRLTRIFVVATLMRPINFDPAKDESNKAKHGLSLMLAADLNWDAGLGWVDSRFEYGETRMVALVPRDTVLYCVAYVDRADFRRVISLRPANRREVKSMSRTTKRAPVRMPTPNENRRINAAAKSDPDAQPLTARQLKAMVPLRGRPKSDNTKLLVSIRYSPEVVAYFRSSGAGWQSRMDGVLRKYVERRSRSA